MSKPVLEARGVTVQFGGIVANNDIDFVVYPGEIVGLIGPNGAGKSTFFAALSGFQRPTAGTITLDGTDITGWKPAVVSKAGLCRTFQITRPFSRLTVFENVLVGAFLRAPSRAGAERIAQGVLELTDLAHLADMPAVSLSVASKKRLEMARAMATQPRILLLDEVMAGLTPVEAEEVIPCVRSIHASGVTLVIVEHVMEILMPLAQRVVVFDQGCVIAQGTPNEIVQDERVLEAYLGEVHTP